VLQAYLQGQNGLPKVTVRTEQPADGTTGVLQKRCAVERLLERAAGHDCSSGKDKSKETTL